MASNLPPQGANVLFSSMPRSVEYTPVNLLAADGAPSRGVLYKPRGSTPNVGVHLMHPRTDQSLNYNIPPLAEAGYLVLGRSGRSPNNDFDTVHEELLLDVAAGVKLLRDAGCEQVVLLGNSGGSSLAALYQSQATAAPGDRIVPDLPYTAVDLRVADLPAADGIVLIGLHIGEGLVLMKMIDPSIVDETDPLSVDRALDIYDPRNGFRLPLSATRYDGTFLERYREAQVARVRRLDVLARGVIAAQLEAAGTRAALGPDADEGYRRGLDRRAGRARFLTIYRTTADPTMVDGSIDPDDRVLGGHNAHPRPDLQNYGQAGFAHYVTPRAWLSTWSGLSSHADVVRCVSAVTTPTLFVHYAGDMYTRLSEVGAVFGAAASEDKSLVIVPGADHYGNEIVDGKVGPTRLTGGTDAVLSWMGERFPVNEP